MTSASVGLGSWPSPAGFDGNNRNAPNTACTQEDNGSGWRYDCAGNLTRDSSNDTAAYDAEGRMTAYCPGQTDPTQCTAQWALGRVVYIYDGEGRRVRATRQDRTVSTYVYDAAGQLAAEYGGTAMAGCLTCYTMVDALGSTRAVTNEAGAPVELHDYLAFGLEAPAGGQRSSTLYASGSVKVKFTGKERDAESGLDYFGARYLSSAQGRFTGVDPENSSAFLYPDDPQSWNGYAYGRNNPLTYVDPDGMNYTVCDTQNHCRDVTDEEYNKWRDAQGKNIIVTTGGNILDRETEKRIGSAQYYDSSGLEALQAAGNRADVLIKDAAKTMAVNAAMTATGVIALRGLGYVAETAQELGIFKNTKVLVNFAHSLMNIRPGHMPPPGGIAEVQQAVEGAIQTGNYALKGDGLFEGSTQINGVTVGFRGRFVDGVARVATAVTKR
jgi:RHS repeat-associated protein